MAKRVDYPYMSLVAAIKIAAVVANCGNSARANTIADALGQSVKGGSFQMKMSSTKLFGLLTGRDPVSITELGLRVVKPLEEAERRKALFEAFKTPTAYATLYNRFKGNNIPSFSFLENLLIREYFVPNKMSKFIVNAFIRSGLLVGVVKKEVDGYSVVDMETKKEPKTEETENEENTQESSAMPFKKETGTWISLKSSFGNFESKNLTEEDWLVVEAMVRAIRSKWEKQKNGNQIESQ